MHRAGLLPYINYFLLYFKRQFNSFKLENRPSNGAANVSSSTYVHSGAAVRSSVTAAGHDVTEMASVYTGVCLQRKHLQVFTNQVSFLGVY
jgi:hypothetical protein